MTERPAGTKKEILETALRLFIRKGFSGTSIREITAELDITPAALYYHFASKDEVLQGIINPLLAAGESHLVRLRGSEDAPATARLALEGYFDLLAANLDGYRLVARDPATRSNPIVARPLRDQAREFFKLLLGADDSIERKIRAAAAVETIRRSLELEQVDVEAHREFIIELACQNLDV